MTKTELLEKVYARAAMPSKAKTDEAVSAVFDCICEALIADDTIVLKDFGTFRVNTRAGRKGRNPRTGEEIDIPASRAVKFSMGKALREQLNP